MDDCDKLSLWNSSAALTLNGTAMQQGTNCIEFNGSTTDEFKKAFSTAYNSGLTVENAVLQFWYFVSDITKCGTVRVELGSSGKADIDELSWPLTGLANGWNLINLKINKASVIGSPDLNAINWFRIYNQKTGIITTRIDGIELVADKLVSISNATGNQNMQIRIFPNPAQNSFAFSGLPLNFQNTKCGLRIFDLAGRQVFADHSADLSGLIPINELTNGVFVVEISNHGSIHRNILIIRK